MDVAELAGLTSLLSWTPVWRVLWLTHVYPPVVPGCINLGRGATGARWSGRTADTRGATQRRKVARQFGAPSLTYHEPRQVWRPTSGTVVGSSVSQEASSPVDMVIPVGS